MSIFTKILEKLGIKKDTSGSVSAPSSTPAGASAPARPTTTAAPAAKPATPAAKPAAPSSIPATSKPAGPVVLPSSAPAKPAAISEVDVVKQLEERAKGSGLDWKVSIVDLLKLLDLDSSREARNELAQELGCPPELMKDSAKMNTWLHKTVLKKIAENGGNIPQSLLD